MPRDSLSPVCRIVYPLESITCYCNMKWWFCIMVELHMEGPAPTEADPFSLKSINFQYLIRCMMNLTFSLSAYQDNAMTHNCTQRKGNFFERWHRLFVHLRPLLSFGDLYLGATTCSLQINLATPSVGAYQDKVKMVDNIQSLNSIKEIATLEITVKPNINTFLPPELLVQILGLLGAQDTDTDLQLVPAGLLASTLSLISAVLPLYAKNLAGPKNMTFNLRTTGNKILWFYSSILSSIKQLT